MDLAKGMKPVKGMRLVTGQAAKDFLAHDIYGQPIQLNDYRNSNLMLSFYRYTACPFSNLRIHRLLKDYERFGREGLVMVAVFQSPRASLLKYFARQRVPFPIIADPGETLYGLYGLHGSWAGLGRSALHPIKMLKALSKGFLPGKPEGDITMLPADFLISPDFIIEKAYYGKDISDHLPIRLIKRWLKSSPMTTSY